MANDPKPIKVEKNETGYEVHFKDMVVGVHSSQASTSKSAVTHAVKVYKEEQEHINKRKAA